MPETIRQIAATTPAAVRVFEKYGIDYCCGGQRPLAEACNERGLSVETVLAEVAAGAAGAAPASNWAEARLADLIDHIVSRHHEYLKTELPVLGDRLAKVVAKHGPKFPEMLARLDSVYGALRAELEMHLMKEETVLFPAIKDIEAAHAAARPPRPMPFGTVRNPIHMMEHEHDNAGEALRLMRSLTGDYTAPEGACPTFHALYRGLDALEQDLHVHIHLENNILFPRAAELETRQG